MGRDAVAKRGKLPVIHADEVTVFGVDPAFHIVGKLTERRDPLVLEPPVFGGEITILLGVARNMAEPAPYASENKKDGETGRVFGD